jgi:hypothetical protein
MPRYLCSHYEEVFNGRQERGTPCPIEEETMNLAAIWFQKYRDANEKKVWVDRTLEDEAEFDSEIGKSMPIDILVFVQNRDGCVFRRIVHRAAGGNYTINADNDNEALMKWAKENRIKAESEMEQARKMVEHWEKVEYMALHGSYKP